MSLNLVRNMELKDLAVLDSDDLTLAVYLPLRSDNSEVNRIRLKNTLSEARALLSERLDDNHRINAVMGELEKLSEHEVFQKALYPGLALLMSPSEPEEVNIFPLWTKPEARVSLGSEPFVTPLIRDSGHQLVTLLCLADNGLRLFRGRLGELGEETPPEVFPKNLAEVIRWEESAGLDGNEHYRNRINSPGAGSQHGEGPVSKVKGEFERRYFREIGSAVNEYLQEGEMLFLAGVHEKLALFREENSSLPILEAELAGNFEGVNADVLVTKANEKLAALAKERSVSDLKRAQELAPERRSNDPEALAEAAAQGRVETLFLKDDNELSDSERLAMSVMRQGGKVQILDVPHWSDSLLGVYRW